MTKCFSTDEVWGPMGRALAPTINIIRAIARTSVVSE